MSIRIFRRSGSMEGVHHCRARWPGRRRSVAKPDDIGKPGQRTPAGRRPSGGACFPAPCRDIVGKTGGFFGSTPAGAVLESRLSCSSIRLPVDCLTARSGALACGHRNGSGSMRIPAEVIPPVANLNKEIEGERKTEPVGGAAGLPDEVSASPDGQAPPFAERGKRRQAATVAGRSPAAGTAAAGRSTTGRAPFGKPAGPARHAHAARPSASLRGSAHQYQGLSAAPSFRWYP
jgi:hypothetical protein